MNQPVEQSLPVQLQGPALVARGPGGPAPKSTAEVACPRSMVGRVIGKNGETIKALQTYTGALIQIDQSTDPTRVTISGTGQSLSLAMSMVSDICKGTFKGFALLRQLIQPQRQSAGAGLGAVAQPRPVYAPGYGLIPPSQLYGDDDPATAAGSAPLVGARPVALQLQPGFQYVPTTGTDAAPLMVGMTGMTSTLPSHTLTQQMDGSTLISSPMPLQQLPVQQVYSSMPMQGGAYHAAQLYYPQEFAGASGEHLIYPQQDGMQFSLQPTQQLPALHSTLAAGSNTGKLISASGHAAHHMAAGRGPRAGPVPSAGTGRWPSGGGGWVDGAKVDSGTMGPLAVNELLRGSSGSGSTAASAMGGRAHASAAVHAVGSGTLQPPQQQQQLVQVIGPEGKLYYLQQGVASADH